MSAEPIKLGNLLREPPSDSPASSKPVELGDIFKDVQIPSGGIFRQRNYRNLPGGILGLIALTGAVVAIVLVMAHAAITTSSNKTITETARQGRGTVSASAADFSAFSKPVQELMRYLDDLRRGKVAFDPGLTGEQAAKQLGYSRLFASAYDEVALRARARQQAKKGLSLGEAITAFENITREEQTIDKLLAEKGRYALAIAYLRALQNGDVSFPTPQIMAPTPPVLLLQLMSAYPDVHVDIRDPVFAEIYRKTRDLVAARVRQKQQVWAQEIIADYRHLIVQSAGGAELRSPGKRD